MKLKILSLLSLEIFLLTLISAETTIPGGTISGTWTKSNSPYNITGNISIPADDTLVIEPGVEVEFSGIYSFTVNGLLEAVGSENDSIHFTASTNWMGLSFNNAPDSSHLAYCIIERSTYGGIVCNNSHPVISHCTIIENGGGFPGFGGIGLNNSNPSISFCSIRNNENLFNSGGGISLENSSPVIFNCSITGNYTSISGGGISCGTGSVPLISHSNISGNEANTSGGGIAVLNGGNPLISNCTISHDTSFSGGGIACLYGSYCTISGCIIASNYATNEYGGGIYILSAVGNVTISNSTIGKCIGRRGGGGVYIEAAAVVSITESTFNANSALGIGGGAICSIDCSNLLIDHCNFVKNSTNFMDGLIHLNGNTWMTIRNSIFKDQSGFDINFQNYDSVSVSHCDFYGSVPGLFGYNPAGLGVLSQTNSNGDSCDAWYNIFKDPLFEDPGAGNFNLSWNNFPVPDQTKSPCIDAGDPDSNQEPDSTFTDIGRYFFDQRVPQIALSDSIFNFGRVTIGQPADSTLSIYNNGSDTLEIHKIFNNQSVFTTDYSPSDSLILPADSISIIITFLPVDTLNIVDTLQIRSNDQDCIVKLIGTGQLPPIIPIDCNGDTNGLALIDSCGICAGGNTGIIPILDKESCTNQLGDIENPSINNILNPNPVQNILHINIHGARAILRISDITGKCLLQKQIIESESTIDISGLKSGIYFVNVLYDNQVFTGRIIKY